MTLCTLNREEDGTFKCLMAFQGDRGRVYNLPVRLQIVQSENGPALVATSDYQPTPKTLEEAKP